MDSLRDCVDYFISYKVCDNRREAFGTNLSREADRKFHLSRSPGSFRGI